ncbi:transcription factor TFIIIC subunit tfc4 [Cladophialophora chaetospira]|uniref:Transcription factor TFIIIC subunit tfc4 n=1 Tax=Cladophialophora chaetospira TaxID=386627 RepID=A0AA38XIZ5_9EURO|nr:transcription factor TFIIIC subunit tfc4 [Cladophialophora chaetospira]
MSNISPNGSLPVERNGSFLPAPQYSWQAQIPPITPDELYSQTSKARVSLPDGYGPGLGSPLQGLPPRPPAVVPAQSLQQTLSAAHFFSQYHPEQRYTPNPFHDRFLTFNRSLSQSQPQGSNFTSPHSQQAEHAVQRGQLYGSSNTFSQQQGQHASTNHSHYPAHPQLHFGGNSAQDPGHPAAAVAFEVSNRVPAVHRQYTFSNHNAVPAQQQPHGEDSPTHGAVQDAALIAILRPNRLQDAPGMSMATSETPDLPLSLIDNGSIPPGLAPKRGRPKKLDVDGEPNKRRKKGTGQKGGWNKDLRTGPRQPINPGPEFNALYAQAIEAYVDEQDIAKALDLTSKAIAINPEIYSAHALQAELLYALGEDDMAANTLLVGAHAMPNDPEVWFQAATALLEGSSEPRSGAVQAAIECYSQILTTGSAAHRHIEARFQRSAVNRAIYHYSMAMRDLEKILKTMPRDPRVLRQFTEICIEIDDLERAKTKYEEIFEYYRENGFHGEQPFAWAHILVYSQVLALEDPQDAAISNALMELKRLSRWILGREDEMYWDDCIQDDREFDPEDEPRRDLVSQFIPGMHPLDAYGTGLPLEIRVRLGILRLAHSNRALDEAMAHFEWLDPEDRDEGASIHEYPDLFLEVAQGLYDAKEYDTALRYFQALKDTNSYSHTDFWLAMGTSTYMCGDKVQALECYEEARIGDDNSVEARTQLSRLFAEMGDKELAMENARAAIRIAESLVPDTGKRAYEVKDLRLPREEAEKALKEAFKLAGEYSGGTPIERIETKLQMVGRGRHRKRLPAKKKSKRRNQADNVEGEVGDGETLPQSTVGRLVVEKVARNRQDRSPPRCEAAPPKYEFRVKRPTVKEREARRTDTANSHYQKLLDSTDDMRAGDENARRTWMEFAGLLLKDFRSNRAFYSDDQMKNVSGRRREALIDERKKWQEQPESSHPEEEEVDPDLPIPSVESTLPTEYLEIAFSEWLDIFLEYALLYSQDSGPDAQTRCYSIIDATLECIIWKRDPQVLLQIYITYLACAMAFRDEDTLFNMILRWFLRTYQFNNDVYRLFGAINLVYPHPVDSTGREGQMKNAISCSQGMQQFIFKQILTMDVSLPGDYDPPEFGPVPKFMRNSGRGAELDTLNEDGSEGTPIVDTARSRSSTEETPELQDQTGAPQEYIMHLTDRTRTPSEQLTAPEDQEHQEPFSQAAQPQIMNQQREIRPTSNVAEMNALLLLLLGQIHYAAAVGITADKVGDKLSAALSYFFRAQSLDPKNPVILLSISLAYMHHVFLKKCDNRHMTLLQGWAFFEEYVDARRDWARRKVQESKDGQRAAGLAVDGLEVFIEREIEFNRARCWHMLGMSEQAVRSYENVLSMPVPTGDDDDEAKNSDFTMDAAYAVSSIYAASGNMEMARQVTENYLVV